MNSNDNNLIKAVKALLNTKTNDVFPKKYSTGGKILSSLAGLIPGVGSIISPMVNIIDQQRDINLLEQEANVADPMKMNTNPYGKYFDGGPVLPITPIAQETSFVNRPALKFNLDAAYTAGQYQADPYSQKDRDLIINAEDVSNIATKLSPLGSLHTKSKVMPFREKAMGGNINSNFKQYNTGTHDSGNDQNISENGTPDNNNTVAAVQGKENSYTQKGKTYIYSDTLLNPDTGNSFNIDAADLNKKYKKADSSADERNALDFSMNRLSKMNDIMRNAKEMVDKACGGYTKGKKMALGGGPDDPVIPPSENLAWQAQNPFEYTVPPILPMLPTITEQKYGTQGMIEANQMSGDGSLAQDTTIFGTEITPIGTNLSTASSPISKLPALSTKRQSINTDGTDYNVPAIIAKGVALGKSVVDALTPAEKEDPILPDYRKSDANMYATNIDYTQAKQDALAASNLAGNVNRSASSNFGQFQGRQAGNYSNLSDRIGNISMQEALQRNQQYVQRAGYEQGKAVDTANRLGQNRIFNQQNQANADFADQKLFSEVADIGSQFNKYEYYQDMVTNKKEIAQATINEGLQLIGSKYSNFGFDANFINKIKSGSASVDELVTFMTTVDQVKSKKETK